VIAYDLLQGPVGLDGARLAATAFTRASGRTIPAYAYNLMRGLSIVGPPMVDPTTGQPTTFAFPGDPLVQTGWLDELPGERGFLLSSGPIRMVPGQVQEIALAIIIGRDFDRWSSYELMRENDVIVQTAFDDGLGNPTAATVSVASVSANANRVRVVWSIAGAIREPVTIEREDGRGWSALGIVLPDGDGRVDYEDRSVEAGRRYGYRLTSAASGLLGGETWVDVPLEAAFALEGLRPNPTHDDVWMSFSLSSEAPCSIEVWDIVGRRVSMRELQGLGPGRHVQRVHDGRRLPAGLYVVRLVQGSSSRTARLVVTR
jgi:hypothetical protein